MLGAVLLGGAEHGLKLADARHALAQMIEQLGRRALISGMTITPCLKEFGYGVLNGERSEGK